MQNSSMSASQEMSLLTKANKLKQVIKSMGLELPTQVLAYHCMADPMPLGMALLGYDVHAVNSDPINTDRIKRYVDTWDTAISYDTYPIFELGKHENQSTDVVVIDGLVMTELRTDSQLEDVSRQLATTIRPDGLLIITTADFDETLQVKDRVLRPHITDDNTGRHLQVIVRDWHGNGYEYTETRYCINHGDGSPALVHQQYQRRAWRNAELTLALIRAGFEDVLWQSDEQYIRIMTARRRV